MHRPEAAEFALQRDKMFDDDDRLARGELFQTLKKGLEELGQEARGEISLRTTYVSATNDTRTTFYEAEKDELYFLFSRAPVVSSQQATPGIALDYDASGGVVGVKIERASVELADVPLRRSLEQAA